MELEQFLTEGALRVIRRAASLAGHQQVDSCSEVHLLAALLLEEGIASESLERQGIGLAKLQESGSNHWQVAWENPTVSDRKVPLSDDLLEILVRARSRSHSGGRPSETDTLDLLLGLVEHGGSIAEFLEGHGVTANSLENQIHRESRTGFNSPLPLEEQLVWKSETSEERLSVLRIVDASCNRLREGIRVVEEYFRFHRNDGFRTGWLKSWRHRLTDVCGSLPFPELLASRETQQDVGTQLTFPSELSRESLEDVLWANLKRCQEACRTLEEYGKLVSSQFAEQLKQLRYELYTFEKGLKNIFLNRRGLILPPLYLLVTEELCRRGSGPVIRGALDAGVRLIQIREKEMDDRRLVEHGRRVREWTREYGAVLIMNDRPDLAVLIDADGVHVGQQELSVADVRKIVGPQRLVGVSTHSLLQAQQAVNEGADYIGVGPVFPSRTKNFSEFPGLELVRNICTEISLPAYAIGGIDRENVSQVVEAGAVGIALSSAICSAEDPHSAAEDLLTRLKAD